MLILKSPSTQAKSAWLDENRVVHRKESPFPPTYYKLVKAVDAGNLSFQELTDVIREARSDPHNVILTASAIHPDWTVPQHVLPYAIMHRDCSPGHYDIRRKDWNNGICDRVAANNNDKENHRLSNGALVETPVSVLSFDVENLNFSWISSTYDPMSAADILSWFTTRIAPELAGVSAVVMFTSNHGVGGPGNEKLRARITFLLEETISVSENKWYTKLLAARSAAEYGRHRDWDKPLIDTAAASRHQVWYTASPEFYVYRTDRRCDEAARCSERSLKDFIDERVVPIDGIYEKVPAAVMKAVLTQRPSKQFHPAVNKALSADKTSKQEAQVRMTKTRMTKMRITKDGRWNMGNIYSRLQAATSLETVTEGSRHSVVASQAFNLGWAAQSLPYGSPELKGVEAIVEDAEAMFEAYEQQARTAREQFQAGSSVYRLPLVKEAQALVKGSTKFNRFMFTFVGRICKRLLALYNTGIPNGNNLSHSPIFCRENFLRTGQKWAGMADSFNAKPLPHTSLYCTEKGLSYETFEPDAPWFEAVMVDRLTFDEIKLKVLQDMTKDGCIIAEFDDLDIANFLKRHEIEVQWNKQSRTTCSVPVNTTKYAEPMHTIIRRAGRFSIPKIEEVFGLDRNTAPTDDYGLPDHLIPVPHINTQDEKVWQRAINSWRIIQARHAMKLIQRIKYHGDCYKALHKEDDPRALPAMQRIVQDILWTVSDPKGQALALSQDDTLARDNKDFHDNIIKCHLPDKAIVEVFHSVAAGSTDLEPGGDFGGIILDFIAEGAADACRRRMYGAAVWLGLSRTRQDPWIQTYVNSGPFQRWGLDRMLIPHVEDIHIPGIEDGCEVDEHGMLVT